MKPNGIKELLTDYAAGARRYDLSARALKRARRRRLLRGPMGASLAITLTFASAWLVLAPGHRAPDSGPAVVRGCPQTVHEPSGKATLPADRPVGRGCVVYESANGNVLVAEDGTQYPLPALVGGKYLVMHGLSPDGRWMALGDPTDGSTTVRDLAGTAVARFDGVPLAWSPDARWLALGQPSSNDPGQITLVEPATAQQIQVDLTAFAGARLLSVLPGGEPVLLPVNSGASVELIIVNPATGREQRRVVVDLWSSLAEGEWHSAWTDPLVTADGRVLVRPLRPLGSILAPGDILVIDLATAAVVGRWHLPSDGTGQEWAPLCMRPEGLLLQHRTPTGRWAIELYDPTTDTIRPVFRLSP